MSEMLTCKELGEIRKREEKATPGPLSDRYPDSCYGVTAPQDATKPISFFDNYQKIAETMWCDDAEFIASSRTDIPRLIATLERAMETLEQVYDSTDIANDNAEETLKHWNGEE